MLTWNIDHRQSASLAIYRNVRVPAANEYGWFVSAADPSAGGTLLKKVVGTNLKAEKAYGVDLAYKITFENGASIKFSGWWYTIRDYINMRSGLAQSERLVPGQGGNLRTAYNMDARRYGLTLSGQLPISEDLSFHGGVTFQGNSKSNDMYDPENCMKKLEYSPAWKGNLGVNWRINDKLNLASDLIYVSASNFFYSTQTESNKIGQLRSYGTLDASLNYSINEKLSMELYVDNLTNSKYSEVFGYPAMGFNMGVSVRWKL
jgi:iron complex outermembrane receptor protein